MFPARLLGYLEYRSEDESAAEPIYMAISPNPHAVTDAEMQMSRVTCFFLKLGDSYVIGPGEEAFASYAAMVNTTAPVTLPYVSFMTREDGHRICGHATPGKALEHWHLREFAPDHMYMRWYCFEPRHDDDGRGAPGWSIWRLRHELLECLRLFGECDFQQTPHGAGYQAWQEQMQLLRLKCRVT